MIRQCLIGAARGQTARQLADGSWTIEGVGSEFMIPILNLRKDSFAPLNSTFFVATDIEECIERIESNLSDVSSILLPIRTTSAHFKVLNPTFASQIQFITGYGIHEDEINGHETATVFSNLNLLQIDVYTVYLSLVITSFFFICLKIWLIASLGRKFNPFVSLKNYLHAVKYEVRAVYNCRSNNFKWITLLLSLSGFFMVTSFLILYKTSHVVLVEPEIARSYEDSIRIESSIAMFYDQFVQSSISFRHAPADSLKGKMWAKSVAAGAAQLFDQSGDPSQFSSLINFIVEAFLEKKGIGVSMSIIMPLMTELVCGFSPENVLFLGKILSDPSESEEILGYPQSNSLQLPPDCNRNQRQLFETHFLPYFYQENLKKGAKAGITYLATTSPHHRWKQSIACEDPDAFRNQPSVKIFCCKRIPREKLEIQDRRRCRMQSARV